VPGGDALGAQRLGVIDKGAELDFTVAHFASGWACVRRGIRAGTGRKRGLVFGREVDRFDLDADHIGDRCGVDQVLARTCSSHLYRLSQFFMNTRATSWPAR
jgi:hypothetical protein